MRDRDRDSAELSHMTAEIRRRIEPFGISLEEISVGMSDEWQTVWTKTLRCGHHYESTLWFNSGVQERWAAEIGRIHLLGHYEKDERK